MKKTFIAMALVALTACNAKHDNPVLQDSSLPFGAPEFAKYESTHYEPAFMEGFAEQRAEIDAIVANPEAPTFDNTIAALERSGKKLAKATGVFFNLNETDADDVMREAEKRLSPLFTEHSAYMTMNEALFARIKALYDDKANLGLTREQEMVLNKYYRMFVKGGALLDADKKAQLMEIEKQLSLASIQFGENALAETNAFVLVITDEKDLAGLPQSSINAAREAAQAAGKEGWLFTLQKPSWIPFLQYADNRELRKQMYLAYINRGDNNNENDNKEVIARILKLRQQKAQLFGYNTFAEFQLEDKMAQTPEAAYNLLMTIWNAALPKAQAEAAELQKMMDAEGKGEKLEAWDWWYYTEKLREAKYALSESELRPYFSLDNVRKGAFMVSEKLFGMKFQPVEGLDVYHPEVETFEVLDGDGSHMALFYTDYFPRATKRAGAWMNNIVDASNIDGENQRPMIVNVGNFTAPTADTPSLLTIDETRTLFHELGHALHGFLTQTKYPSVSGTSVARDFVELPSQIMEHWAIEPEVLKQYALHYETGEPITDELIAKMQAASSFNSGFETVELVGAALLDMEFHMLNDYTGFEANAFEKAVADKIGLIPQIAFRYRGPYFNHVFSGGYAVGYYSYLWAEVLDADGFEAFRENGIFDEATGRSFRKNILEMGGSEEPMTLYKRFRGAEPNPEALLRSRGLID
ncbi:MAG: M3 family metallopeptidase [Bacteroidaceae bacterium]|nr:M3 family metallopeptidase [Bacteroidaceae bacterium]MBR5149465.1 M3 family metallopeptidase [Bacteroidaceae bacterium]